ncbi:hypothetical protein GCM10027261_22580 [Geodermatophilus arenarius]
MAPGLAVLTRLPVLRRLPVAAGLLAGLAVAGLPVLRRLAVLTGLPVRARLLAVLPRLGGGLPVLPTRLAVLTGLPVRARLSRLLAVLPRLPVLPRLATLRWVGHRRSRPVRPHGGRIVFPRPHDRPSPERGRLCTTGGLRQLLRGAPPRPGGGGLSR